MFPLLRCGIISITPFFHHLLPPSLPSLPQYVRHTCIMVSHLQVFLTCFAPHVDFLMVVEVGVESKGSVGPVMVVEGTHQVMPVGPSVTVVVTGAGEPVTNVMIVVAVA